MYAVKITDGLNSAACSATILCKVTSNFACTSNQCACDSPYQWVSGSNDCSACITNYALISSVCCKYDSFNVCVSVAESLLLRI